VAFLKQWQLQTEQQMLLAGYDNISIVVHWCIIKVGRMCGCRLLANYSTRILISGISITETETETEMINISKTFTETNTEKNFKTETI
jgi:hypothetical protein